MAWVFVLIAAVSAVVLLMVDRLYAWVFILIMVVSAVVLMVADRLYAWMAQDRWK